MIAIFMIANPAVFTHWPIYSSVLVTLPVALFLVVPLVFIVTVGEIDLSFPATMGFSAWIFALVVQAGFSPFLGIVAAIVDGMVLGARRRRPGRLRQPVVADRDARHELHAARPHLDRHARQVDRAGRIAGYDGGPHCFRASCHGFPVQILWALAFVAFCRRCCSTAIASARACMRSATIPTAPRRWASTSSAFAIATFVFMGLGAALAGVFSTMINFTWWPTTGDGYLLPAIASVFVGGTPTWGGVGTIAGGAIGALIVSFIQTGIVAAGLSGFYVQFFNGLIIILSLLGHRWNQNRYR